MSEKFFRALRGLGTHRTLRTFALYNESLGLGTMLGPFGVLLVVGTRCFPLVTYPNQVLAYRLH